MGDYKQIGQYPDREILWIHVHGTFVTGVIDDHGRALHDAMRRDTSFSARVAFQAVNYPFVEGAVTVLTGGHNGAAMEIVSLVRRWVPKSKTKLVVMSGHSQGAMIIRRAFAFLRDSEQIHVCAVVLMGDVTAWGIQTPWMWDDRWIYVRNPTDWSNVSGVFAANLGHLTYKWVVDDILPSVRKRVQSGYSDLESKRFSKSEATIAELALDAVHNMLEKTTQDVLGATGITMLSRTFGLGF